MAEILLFHHIQGLTPGVLDFADALRRGGHTVHAPDLFDGRTFETIEAGQGFCRGVGFGEIQDRGVRAAEGLPDELVYSGFSLGVMPAQALVQNRRGARGALFFHSFVTPAEFGTWPDGVPLQIHARSDRELRGRRGPIRQRGPHDYVEQPDRQLHGGATDGGRHHAGESGNG